MCKANSTPGALSEEDQPKLLTSLPVSDVLRKSGIMLCFWTLAQRRFKTFEIGVWNNYFSNWLTYNQSLHVFCGILIYRVGLCNCHISRDWCMIKLFTSTFEIFVKGKVEDLKMCINYNSNTERWLCDIICCWFLTIVWDWKKQSAQWRRRGRGKESEERGKNE